MPAKNRIKNYQENAWYHLYNRGVEKRPIFRDAQDYTVFLSYLKIYLEPKETRTLRSIISNPTAPWRDKDNAIKLLRLNNFSDTLSLATYCLMPNHFHFLIHQHDANTIDRFMNSLGTRYTMYVNKKYKRVGPLFQGVYKAVMVENDEQLLYLTRYIHRNPIASRRKIELASQGQALRSWSYSSYLDYIDKRRTQWIKPHEILKFFSKRGFSSYESFVNEIEYNETQTLHVDRLKIDQ